jgi:4-alpha-glucanotransferase
MMSGAEVGPLSTRRAGVLLHVTSLPGGRLGPEAYEFVSRIATAGVTVWQVLPLVPPDEEGSPYRALSAMAGHPGLLDPAEPLPAADAPAYRAWCEREAAWLDPYVEYLTVRTLLGGVSWPGWEPGLRDRDPARVRAALGEAAELAERLRAEQWLFADQWGRLREFAADRGVLLYGDLPIFVAHDSADVWADRDLFQLDADGRPTTVTGVPPDYFAADGQRWNNPHYDWSAMAADGYTWWRRRIARQRDLFDLVRIDHFRGFEAAWHVPADAPTAKDGWWTPGPGLDLLQPLVEAAGPGSLVAEDLGVITPEVDRMRRAAGLPGMKVLQFAFDGDPRNTHLPAHHAEHTVVYTGTHDNDTTLGWWRSLDDGTRDLVRAQLLDPDEAMPGAMVRLAMSSKARLAVVPVQDLLGLGSSARMNTPGVPDGNWTWRAERGAIDDAVVERLRDVVSAGDRLAPER